MVLIGGKNYIRVFLEKKYDVIQDFLGESDERGMSFLYRMLELIRNQKEKINFARFVYLLSRLEPDKEGEKERKISQSFPEKCINGCNLKKTVEN